MNTREMCVTENGLDLAAINPSNGLQFSPNLYRFLRKHGSTRAKTWRVFRDGDNTLWVGLLDDG